MDFLRVERKGHSRQKEPLGFRLLSETRSSHWGVAIWAAPLFSFLVFLLGTTAHATVSVVSLQGPSLTSGVTANLTSPIHFQATAESDTGITGYVVYVDDQNVYQNFVPLLDTWVVIGSGTHSV